MNRFLLLGTILLLILPGFTANAENKENMVDLAESLVKNIERINDASGSLKIDMQMNLPLPMRVLAQIRCNNNQYGLFVFDGFDHTPILIVTEETAMINDPLNEGVLLVSPAGITFETGPQNEQYNAYFSFTTPDKGKIINRINMDLVSLFARIEKDKTAYKNKEGLIVYQGKSKRNSSCKAVFKPEAPLAMQSLEINLPDEKEPIMSFPSIQTNIKNDPTIFNFPLAKLENSGLKVTRAKPEGFVDKMSIMANIMRALFVRVAIRNEKLRNEICKNFNLNPNWEQININDRTRSEILKNIFKPVP
jgi:hypothetical protein